MKSGEFGAGAGAGVGVLMVAVTGAGYGLIWGSGANDQYPPGLLSAGFSALTFVMALGPIAALAGGLLGGVYGMGVAAGVAKAGRDWSTGGIDPAGSAPCPARPLPGRLGPSVPPVARDPRG